MFFLLFFFPPPSLNTQHHHCLDLVRDDLAVFAVLMCEGVSGSLGSSIVVMR
jgi:hypothetical protein